MQRQAEAPPESDDIRLHPEVLRAVAKKMRERNPQPDVMMPAKIYVLNSVMHEFILGLEAVANDTERDSFVQQKETDG